MVKGAVSMATVTKYDHHNGNNNGQKQKTLIIWMEQISVNIIKSPGVHWEL